MSSELKYSDVGRRKELTLPDVVKGSSFADHDDLTWLASLLIRLNPREKEVDDFLVVVQSACLVETFRAHERHDNCRESHADEVFERANRTKLTDHRSELVLALLLDQVLNEEGLGTQW